MARHDRTDESLRGPPRCPACGGVLDLDLLEVEEDDGGEGELLLLLDCPRGDFRATATYGDVVAALAAEVARRLAASR